MNGLKQVALITFHVAKVYFLLLSFFLLLASLFIALPYVSTYFVYDSIGNPGSWVDYIPVVFLTVGLIWIFIIGFKIMLGPVKRLAKVDSIAFYIIVGTLGIPAFSYIISDTFGLNWWIGGVVLLAILGLFGVAYCILKVLKYKREK